MQLAVISFAVIDEVIEDQGCSCSQILRLPLLHMYWAQLIAFMLYAHSKASTRSSNV